MVALRWLRRGSYRNCAHVSLAGPLSPFRLTVAVRSPKEASPPPVLSAWAVLLVFYCGSPGGSGPRLSLCDSPHA